MAAPLRIVHFLHAFKPAGMEHGILKVICGASPGFTHAVVAKTIARELPEQLPANTPVVEMDHPGGNSLRFIRRLRRTFRELNADIVHTRNWGGLDGIMAARWARIRVVHGEHGFAGRALLGGDLHVARVGRPGANRTYRYQFCIARRSLTSQS